MRVFVRRGFLLCSFLTLRHLSSGVGGECVTVWGVRRVRSRLFLALLIILIIILIIIILILIIIILIIIIIIIIIAMRAGAPPLAPL